MLASFMKESKVIHKYPRITKRNHFYANMDPSFKLNSMVVCACLKNF